MTDWETEPETPDEGEEKVVEEREEFVVVESANGGPDVFKPKRLSPDAEVEPDTTADDTTTDARPDENSAHDRGAFLRLAEAESKPFDEEVAHLNESICLFQTEQKDCNKAIADIRKEAQDGGRKLTNDEQAQIVKLDTMLREEIGSEILRKNNRLREIQMAPSTPLPPQIVDADFRDME
ncbi:hypothetical protein MBLNU457_5773t1 [Dothideomycetes sp. NU457]